jgi:hypothetical protein
MTTKEVSRPSGSNYLRWTARILALAVASFWLWWGVGSAYIEGFSWLGLLAHCIPGLLILIGALVAWKWEGIGGSLLVGVAVLVTAFLLWAISRGGYGGTYRQVAAIVWLTMALPPLLAGVLFLASWREHLGGEDACLPNIDTPFSTW